jgi:hypothetical protein
LALPNKWQSCFYNSYLMKNWESPEMCWAPKHINFSFQIQFVNQSSLIKFSPTLPIFDFKLHRKISAIENCLNINLHYFIIFHNFYISYFNIKIIPSLVIHKYFHYSFRLNDISIQFVDYTGSLNMNGNIFLSSLML